MLITLNKVTY